MSNHPTHPFHLAPAQEQIAGEYALRLVARLTAYQGVTATVARQWRGLPEVSVGARIMPGAVGLRMYVWPRHLSGDLSWHRGRPARGAFRYCDTSLRGPIYFQYVRPVAELDPLAADLVASLQRRAAASDLLEGAAPDAPGTAGHRRTHTITASPHPHDPPTARGPKDHDDGAVNDARRPAERTP
ncbi:hypothetical protein SMC26_23845 [Actinomadura fulvescens]